MEQDAVELHRKIDQARSQLETIAELDPRDAFLTASALMMAGIRHFASYCCDREKFAEGLCILMRDAISMHQKLHADCHEQTHQ